MKKSIRTLLALFLASAFLFHISPLAAANKLVAITFVKGAVFTLATQEGATWHPAEKDTLLQPGDKIRTDADGKAVVQYQDISVVKIRHNSICTPLPLTSTLPTMKLLCGSLFVKVDPTRRANFQIESGKAIGGVRGTEFEYTENPVLQSMAEILKSSPDLDNIETTDPQVLVTEGKVQFQSRSQPRVNLLLTRGNSARLKAAQQQFIRKRLNISQIKKRMSSEFSGFKKRSLDSIKKFSKKIRQSPSTRRKLKKRSPKSDQSSKGFHDQEQKNYGNSGRSRNGQTQRVKPGSRGYRSTNSSNRETKQSKNRYGNLRMQSRKGLTRNSNQRRSDSSATGRSSIRNRRNETFQRQGSRSITSRSRRSRRRSITSRTRKRDPSSLSDLRK